jgi:hypothetical protein
MGQIGLGVMINALGGNEESFAAMTATIGKTIARLTLSDDALRFVFSDDSKLKISDEGQSCCESRYMTTDDNLADYIGAKLLSAAVKDGPTETGEYGDDHEIAFLEVATDRGSFTVATHNEHNGYYGGFAIVASNRD